MLWETGLDISPKYLGDDQVLLLGLTNRGAEQLMNDRQQGGRPLFSTIEKWNPSLRTTFRLTWVQVWGIPPQAWNLKHIRSILAAMGDTVDVDDDTEAKRRLDRARVLVKTQWRPTINHMVDVHISGDIGNSFKVYIVEESGGGSHECRRRRCSLSGTSDKIVSDDSSLGHFSLPSSSCNYRHTADQPDEVGRFRRTPHGRNSGASIVGRRRRLSPTVTPFTQRIR